MDYPVITKPRLEEFRVRPNLEEHHRFVKGFTWEQLRGELDGLPGGGLNLAHEAIDRHAQSHLRDRVALYWEGTGGEEERYTFALLKELTDRFANVLKGLGVKKGDRVFLFVPDCAHCREGLLHHAIHLRHHGEAQGSRSRSQGGDL